MAARRGRGRGAGFWLTLVSAGVAAVGVVLFIRLNQPFVDFYLRGVREKEYVDPSGIVSFFVCVKNTGETDADIWIVVTAENGTVVSFKGRENATWMVRTGDGIRVAATAKEKEELVWTVEVRLVDLPPSFRVSLDVERRGILIAEFNPYEFTSVLYRLEKKGDGMAVYDRVEE